MDRIAVLIPCFNEELSIGKVIDDVHAFLPEATVYVYDNNSTDKTAEIALSKGAVVRREYQQGKGNVVRRMFREIDAESYLMVDGDNTYPLEEGRAMVDHILSGEADMVVGDRLSSTYYKENKRPFHNFGNALVKFFVNLLFGHKTKIQDIMTGFRAFSYAFVKTFPVISKGFEIETEMTIHALSNNLAVVNHVVNYRDRQAGSSSKLNTFNDGQKVLRTIYRLYKFYRPKSFFYIFSAILFALSVGFFIPVLLNFFQTHTVEKIPTVIVCGSVFVVSVLSFFTGIILSHFQYQKRLEFEMRLILADDSFKQKKKDDSLL